MGGVHNVGEEENEKYNENEYEEQQWQETIGQIATLMQGKSFGKGNRYEKGKGQYTPGKGNHTPYGTPGYQTLAFSNGSGKGYPTTPFYAKCNNCCSRSVVTSTSC